MTTILTKSGPGNESQNTFNLPTGGEIRDELISIFRDQQTAILAFLKGQKNVDNIVVDDAFGDFWLRDRDSKRETLERTARTKDQGMGGSNWQPEITGLEFKWGLPLAWPTWDSLGLGVLNFVERLETSIKAIWEKAGAGFLALLGLDPDGWDANDPKNIALIEQGLKDLATEVNNTTSQQLQAALDTVTKEVNNGTITTDQAEAELTKDVDEIFNDAESWRARMIAVTEASRAYHEAIAAAAREFGDVIGWKWVCAEGACPICLEVEAECQFVPDGRPFAIVGDNQTYQTIDMPPLHPNCYCTAHPVMAGDEPPDWGETLIQPTGKKGYAPEQVVLGLKAWPKPKRFPGPKARDRVERASLCIPGDE